MQLSDTAFLLSKFNINIVAWLQLLGFLLIFTDLYLMKHWCLIIPIGKNILIQQREAHFDGQRWNFTFLSNYLRYGSTRDSNFGLKSFK